MTEREYNAIYERVKDDINRGHYFDPMMNMVNVVTIDESSNKIIPIVSKDCETLTHLEKQMCAIVENCITGMSESIDYAEAVLLLADTYKENIQSYMNYGRFVTPGLYPVRYYQLRALAWTGELKSDILCLCTDPHDRSQYQYIKVCKSGYIERMDKCYHRLFDLDDDEPGVDFCICFLIDLKYADFIRRKIHDEESKKNQ